MDLVFIQLFFNVAGKSRVVMTGGKVLIADGFGKSKLDLVHSIFLCQLEHLFHLHFFTQVMAAHTGI